VNVVFGEVLEHALLVEERDGGDIEDDTDRLPEGLTTLQTAHVVSLVVIERTLAYAKGFFDAALAHNALASKAGNDGLDGLEERLGRDLRRNVRRLLREALDVLDESEEDLTDE
jgi:hypothetical protein